KRGKIIALFPKKQRAIVEGLHMIKRHTRKSQQHPNGAIIEREGTIHISNLTKAENVPQPAQAES
ncbi:MAG TPA: 50S ribosomal protein L24, partial [Verrucomicrobiae bacterium]|nr:50S ribosomal protein L24 [Verrucomicrobiae bacterium]